MKITTEALDEAAKALAHISMSPAEMEMFSALSSAGRVARMPGSIRPERAMSSGYSGLRDQHAARVLASVHAPLHITAATLRARQPREADRAPLPLP